MLWLLKRGFRLGKVTFERSQLFSELRLDCSKGSFSLFGLIRQRFAMRFRELKFLWYQFKLGYLLLNLVSLLAKFALMHFFQFFWLFVVVFLHLCECVCVVLDCLSVFSIVFWLDWLYELVIFSTQLFLSLTVLRLDFLNNELLLFKSLCQLFVHFLDDPHLLCLEFTGKSLSQLLFLFFKIS